MNAPAATADSAAVFYVAEEEHHAPGGSTHLGFWIYLMSDTLIFSALLTGGPAESYPNYERFFRKLDGLHGLVQWVRELST